MSYTRFEWTGARVVAADDGEGWTVSLTVHNTGQRAGAEVVQVYVSPPASAVERPPRELAAFARVALAPGASERVELMVPRQALAYWDEKQSAWAVEQGEHRLLLGASSRDIRHHMSIQATP